MNMFPFSPQYLHELSGNKRIITNENLIIYNPLTNTQTQISNSIQLKSERFYISKINNKSSIIACKTDGELFLSGFGSIILLKGYVSINGYNLIHSKATHVNCPIWQPANLLNCSGQHKNQKTSIISMEDIFKQLGLINENLTKLQKQQLHNIFNSFICVFMITNIAIEDQEWLIAAEEQSIYQPKLNDNNSIEEEEILITDNNIFTLTFRSVENIKLSSIMIGLYSDFYSNCIDCLLIPQSWIDNVDIILENTYINNNKNYINKTIICGAKGIGKSTCLKYLINRIISDKHQRFIRTMYNKNKNNYQNTIECIHDYKYMNSICLIDCDIGQPELSISGSVSLYIITTPLIDPAHLNQHILSDTTYFIGDVTNKYEPKLFLKYIQLLYQRYLELQQQYIKQYNLYIKEKTKKFVLNNTYNALLLSDDDNIDNNTSDNTLLSNKAIHLPLIINTDGYIKNMGSEILNSILTIVEPTNIFHICTEKDQSILSHILEDYIYNMNNLHNTLLNNTLVNHDKHFNNINNNNNNNNNNIIINNNNNLYNYYILEPGRIYHSAKVAAIELRTLRYVAYFLRHNPFLLMHTKNINDYYYQQQQKQQQQQNQSMAHKDTHLQSVPIKDIFYIRNGTIIDPTGVISMYLIKSSSYIIPFSECTISSIPTTDLPNRLLLASINVSIVGLVEVNDSCYSINNENTMNLYKQSNKKFKYILTNHSDVFYNQSLESNNHNEYHNLKEEETIQDTAIPITPSSIEFELNCLPEYPIGKCIGIGIIRYIDVENASLSLITPYNSSINSCNTTTTPYNSSINSCNTTITTTFNTSTTNDILITNYNNSIMKKLCLLRNNLQIPPIFLYSPSLVCYPYFSNESTGEGSTQLRSRNNVKRRTQQFN